MARDADELIARWNTLPRQPDALRDALKEYDDVVVDHALRKLSQGSTSYEFLTNALTVFLGPADDASNVSIENTREVAEAVDNLLWHVATDPTYGGNIRAVINYYRSCDLGSRAKIVSGLLGMLQLPQYREDAQTLIAGAPVFADWRSGAIPDCARRFGEKLPNERKNPAFPKGK